MSYKETCLSCKVVKDFTTELMECISCKDLVCIDCTVTEEDTTSFIKKTGKGEIFSGHKDPDMNGPCGWVCPKCYVGHMGIEPKGTAWTENSPSSGGDVSLTPEQSK